MRLKEIATVDFRASPETNFEEWAKKNKTSLRLGEVLCFINGGRNMLYFVSAPSERGTNGRGAMTTVMYSQRLVINGGRFEPLMLADYANDAGIKLEGLKRYEEHYKELVKQQNEHRRKLREDSL